MRVRAGVTREIDPHVDDDDRADDGAHAELDALMRSRLGAHLAGLLAAAEAPLTSADLSRLTGRPDGAVSSLLPRTGDVRRVDGRSDAWELVEPDAVARVVRNLHSGPLPPGAEHRAPTRELALAPFRSALLATLDAARTEWGWAAAPEFALSAEFARSMHDRRGERRALVATLTDPQRSRLLQERHPDAARDQLREAAADLAAATASAGDLEDVATLLLAEQALDETGGAVPRRLPPVFALLGDTERALVLARLVRTDVPIELAYVALAAAQAGDIRAEAIADDALALLGDGAPGALLRTAQALAGTALYLPADAARRLATTARRLVEQAFADAPQHEAVAGLRARQFRASRDHEWALGATTLATAAVAAIQASAGEDGAGGGGGGKRSRKSAKESTRNPTGESAGESSIRAAFEAVRRIADDGRRAVVLADVAARLAVRTTAAAPSPTLDAAADSSGETALTLAAAAGDHPDTLVAVARLLSGGAAHDGDSPEAPARPDVERAGRAARRALQLLASADPAGDDFADGARAAAGLLLAAARALPAAERAEWAVPAARAVVAAAEARRASRSDAHTRASGDPAALAEAAAILDGAGAADEARTAAESAMTALARVPAPARARREAEVAAALLHAEDGEVFAAARTAAAAERAGTAGRWDPAAPALVAEAGIRLRHPHDAAPGEAEDAAGLTPARATIVDGIVADAIAALRRGESAAQLTTLADLSARRVDPAGARSLAMHALRAARVRDPLLLRRAEEALGEARAAAREVAGDLPSPAEGRRRQARPMPDAPTLDARAAAAIAAAWVADGYPFDRLAELVRADPVVGERVIRGVAADIAR